MSRISDMGARSDAMNDVAKALGLEQAPLRIECYDISNTVGGAFQVASMVVFEDAIAKSRSTAVSPSEVRTGRARWMI